MTTKATELAKSTGEATGLFSGVSVRIHRIYALPCSILGIDPRGCDFLTKFTKFSLVGGTGVLVNSAALFLLYDKAQLPLVLASAIAVEAAIVNNFLLNDRWTFHVKVPRLTRFAKFNIVSMVGLAITTFTLWLLATYLGVHYLLANLVGIGLATGWNFAVNLFWTWGLGR